MDIVLVDDDPQIRLAFTTALRRRGHEVRTAGSVGAAVELIGSGLPDVAIIDVMLPDGDGIGLCRLIRARWGLPTIMLTARDADADIVDGLEAGADDYIVKPVGAAVLEARVRAVVRRAAVPAGTDFLTVGGYILDEEAQQVRAGEVVVPLTSTEFRLLRELAAHAGQVMSRRRLVDAAWAEAAPDTLRVVDTTMQRLRSKLAAPGVAAPEIETVRGIGYRLT